MRTDYYDQLLKSMPAGLEKQVYNTMQHWIGKTHSIRLEMLTIVVCGSDTESNKRMVRKAIETLRETRGIPILANSGKAGYYFAANRAELEEFVAEMRSRRNRLDTTIRRMQAVQFDVSQGMLL